MPFHRPISINKWYCVQISSFSGTEVYYSIGCCFIESVFGDSCVISGRNGQFEPGYMFEGVTFCKYGTGILMEARVLLNWFWLWGQGYGMSFR